MGDKKSHLQIALKPGVVRRRRVNSKVALFLPRCGGVFANCSIERNWRRYRSGDRPEIQESVPAVAEFPEAADVLNQLKARRKKSRADLADVEAILELLGG
jgi:hypothetical protein